MKYPVKKKSGFTLIELVVAISILSGLLVLSIGALARSTASVSTTESVRERTEAARNIVDMISNDFQNIYFADLNFPTNGGGYVSVNNGFSLQTPNNLTIVVKYPNNNNLFVKNYSVVSRDSHNTISLVQGECAGADLTSCVYSDSADLLSTRYAVDQGTNFAVEPESKILNLTLSIKDVNTTESCTTNRSSCYTLSSKFVAKERL